MKNALFERVIGEVLAELPPDLKAALATVEIDVRESPSAGQRAGSGLGAGDDLFGLFEGYSLKEIPPGRDRPFPDRITVFAGPLRRCFPRKDELEREVRATLIHELGHFFGFSERELLDRGLG